jgi:hypothetical protein
MGCESRPDADADSQQHNDMVFAFTDSDYLIVLFRVLSSYWVGSCVPVFHLVSTPVSQSEAEYVASTKERSAFDNSCAIPNRAWLN